VRELKYTAPLGRFNMPEEVGKVTDFDRARPNADDRSWNCRRCSLRSCESDLVPATSRDRDLGKAAEIYEDQFRA
jgi:hypothetical protein